MTRMTPKTTGLGLRSSHVLIAFAANARSLTAQTPSQRFVGTITSISGDTLTVKTDSGESHQVQVPGSAALKRISPGQKDLNTAETIQLGDLATGDRVPGEA